MQDIIYIEPKNSTFAMSENLPQISEELFWSIILACPKNGTILELGSGATTELISKHRKIYSIENDDKYIGAYNKREYYIYAPCDKDNWYDNDAIKTLPGYDVLFIDGPAHDSRIDNFVKNIHLFDKKAHWFFDDIAHASFLNGLIQVQAIREKTMVRFDKCYKEWGVITGD